MLRGELKMDRHSKSLSTPAVGYFFPVKAKVRHSLVFDLQRSAIYASITILIRSLLARQLQQASVGVIIVTRSQKILALILSCKV